MTPSRVVKAGYSVTRAFPNDAPFDKAAESSLAWAIAQPVLAFPRLLRPPTRLFTLASSLVLKDWAGYRKSSRLAEMRTRLLLRLKDTERPLGLSLSYPTCGGFDNRSGAARRRVSAEGYEKEHNGDEK